MLRTLRAKGRLCRARKTWEATAGQFGALVFAAIVAALVQVPFAADQIAEADTPPPPSEVLQARTISSRTHDNHDGTYTTSLYSGPVHYRDAQGRWRSISSAVVPTTESGYGLQNEANRFRTLFKSTLANDYLALETSGGRFRVSLQNAVQVGVQTGPRRVIYPGVFAGVDLRYELRPDGLKETLLLQNAQAPTSYRFLLTPPANARIHAAQSRDGSWAFFMAPHARPVFVIDAPWAAEDDEPDSRRSHASLAVTRIGDVFALDLSVDSTWLRAPGRQFPVRLDPTITIQPTFQDASFNFACPGCSGVASDRLSIGTGSTGLATSTWRSALQFSLADIPPGATISNAKLKLYFDGACVAAPGPTCGGTSHQIDVLRMTSSWSPSSKTSELNTVPIIPNPSFTLPASASAQWMNWDITGTVQNWASGGAPSNFGLLLKRATEPANASGPKPPSRNYAAEPTLGPTLQVTYNGDGGELLEPETVHANGAELRWIPYGGPGAPPFSSYEVHRSTNTSFTPSDSTRLTKILDSAVTSYRDTTAKAGAAFTYKVVVGGFETNSRTVTMPAAGEARKLLRADPAAGRGTYFTFRSDYTECANRGEAERMKVGTDTNSIFRTLLRFDLGQMPTNTTVSQATLSLWHPETSGASALTIRAHRLTGHWLEGTGKAECTGDGTTWYETTGGVDWLTLGGDFDPAVIGTISVPSGQAPGWNTLNIASLAQQWARGEKPNHGLIFKLDGETIVAGKYVDYYADDFAVAPTLRPKLSLTYTETTSASVAPRVNVSKPRPGELVKGSSVELAAVAWDDRRVESVQFLVDGNSVGTDTSEPFSINWNSTTIANGSHNLTAKATDDAGNQTTSSAVSVTVGNSAPPTTSITAPAPPPNPPVVSGTVTVTANAYDDVGVTKVELYADGRLVATDTVPDPNYSFSWNTLSPALPAYDGNHTLTTKAYDGHGQVTTSAPLTVTAANTVATMYRASYSSTPTPHRMEYKRTPPAVLYPVDVTVTNLSAVTWSTVVLRYRWYGTDPAVPLPGGGQASVGTLLPNGSVPVHLDVEPPALPPGVARSGYRLRFDLYDTTSSSFFAARGNKSLQETVSVGVQPEEERLGIEPYFEYAGEDLGLGMQNLVNVATGNSVVRWTPLQAPGQGLSTVVELTYNSTERQCNAQTCPAGNGWSLAVSSLTRFGKHMFKAHGNNKVDLVDADGTLHVFTLQGGRWVSPDGIHLYLREDTGSQTRRWAVTRPDRVTYFYDCGGNPTFVRDKNGNELTFELDDPNSCNETKRVLKVTDEGGRFFQLDYYQGDPHNGRLQRITDHLGHKLEFRYEDEDDQPSDNDHANLIEVIEIGGTRADGSPLPDRSVEFTYDDDGDAGTGCDENGPLASVEDPRDKRTTFDYVDDDDGQGGSERKLCARADRAGKTTKFEYTTLSNPDPPGKRTTVKAPPAESRVTQYDDHTNAPNEAGLIDKITRFRSYPSGGESTETVWTAASPQGRCLDAQAGAQPLRHVWKVIEPSSVYTERCYNHNGLVTHEWDQLGNHTESIYENSCVDGSTSDTNRSLSDLRFRRDPRQNLWEYQYYTVPSSCSPGTMPNGNLHKVIDPVPPPNQGITTYTYDQANNWNLDTVTDANGNPTTYRNYDLNGFPTVVTDAEGQVTKYSYDADGLLRTMQDPLHPDEPVQNQRFYKTVYDYDSFHRLGRQSSPKSTRFEFGTLIWTETAHDANDNVVTEIQPYYGSDPRYETRFEYDGMDRKTCVVEPQLPAQTEQPEITLFEYDDAGRLIRTTSPKGVTPPEPPALCPSAPQGNDYVTESVYDALDRVVSEKRYDEYGNPDRKTHYCYQHDTGELLWVVAPNANLPGPPAPPSSCNDQNPQQLPSYLTRYTYDGAHRQKTETTQAGPGAPLRTRELFYDENGNVTREDNELGTRTEYTYTKRDELEKTIETFREDEQHTPTRTLTTSLKYDKVGNLVLEASPRAWDKEDDPVPDPDPVPPEPGDDYVVEYLYDMVDRLNRIAMADDQENTRKYIHRAYDPNGNLKTTTLPVEAPEFGTLCQSEPDKCTELSYWDASWIRTSEDHTLARVLYDYAAEGWQRYRFSERAQGREMFWHFAPDGMLSRAVDRQGHPAEYNYDRNDNLVTTIEARSQGREPLSLTIESEHNGYDEPTKTRIKKATDTNWRFTRYTYDRNGNIDTRKDDGLETGASVEVEPPRVHDYAYNEVDELTEHLDLGTDNGQLSEGDRKFARNYEKTGWLKDETLSRYTNSTWAPRRSTAWNYFVNGDLETLTTRTGAINPPAPLVEKHTLDYEQCPDPDVACDPAEELYLNGNRTRDAFQLVGPSGPPPQPTGCEDAGTCAMDYTYGPRENLTEEKRSLQAGTTWTCHTFDPAQNIDKEWIRAVDCDVQPLPPDPTRDLDYAAGNRLTQLTDRSQGTRIHKYFYDDDGNLDCVTNGAWASNPCPDAPGQGGIPDAALEEDLDWHYSGRIFSYRRFENGEKDSADYDHDPLDRLYRETEYHPSSGAQTMNFFYRGPTDLVRSETSGTQEKRYTYTLEDSLLALDSDPGGGAPTQSRAYAANVHTDVSLLLSADEGSSEVTASYGYQPYGGEDTQLTQGDPSGFNQLNPYRFNAKRLDTGSATLDLGARRYSHDIGRFLQRDLYLRASSDARLDTKVVTQNRYGWAGSNPVFHTELDGHGPTMVDCGWRHVGAFAGRRVDFDYKYERAWHTYFNWRLYFYAILDLTRGEPYCTWRVTYGVAYDPVALRRTGVQLETQFEFTTIWASGYRVEWRTKPIRVRNDSGKWPQAVERTETAIFVHGSRQRRVDFFPLVDAETGYFLIPVIHCQLRRLSSGVRATAVRRGAAAKAC